MGKIRGWNRIVLNYKAKRRLYDDESFENLVYSTSDVNGWLRYINPLPIKPDRYGFYHIIA